MRSVGHGGDGTEGLWRLSIGHNLAIRSIDTGKVLVFTFACLKSAVLGIVRRIEGTANAIVNVLTVVCGIGFARVACLEAKGISTYKAKENFS